MRELKFLRPPARGWVVKFVLALAAALILVAGPIRARGAAGQRHRRVTLLDYTAPVPDPWVAEKPATSFRLAQFKISGKSPADQAAMVVFYFGAGQGGSPEANIARWVSQFSRAGGGRVEPRVRRYRVGRLPATRVELTGSYARGVGMGPQSTPLPNQTLLATIVETPKGNFTFQLWGPSATVAANGTAYDEMIAGLKPAGN